MVFEEKLKPCENIARCRDGWLSPEGDCYAFSYSYSGHELLAEAIIETLHLREKIEKKAFYTIMEDSDFLESLGWVRLSTTLMWSVRLNESYWEDKELTQAQIDTLFDWCNVHAMDFPPQLKGECL